MASNQPSQCDPLWIGNLPYDTQIEDLWKICGAFGTVENIELHRDPKTGRSMGWVFCQYYDYESATIAKAILGGISYGGRTLAVEWAANKSRNYSAPNQPVGKRSCTIATRPQPNDIASMTYADLREVCSSIEDLIRQQPHLHDLILRAKPDEWRAYLNCQSALAACGGVNDFRSPNMN